MKNTQWIFFDIGSTLVDESIAYRKRIEKTISGTDVSYDDFYNKMVEISKQNQNGYQKALEAYGLTMVPWNSEDEFVYPEAEECLQYLSQKYQIGIIANQVLAVGNVWEKMVCCNISILSLLLPKRVSQSLTCVFLKMLFIKPAVMLIKR